MRWQKAARVVVAAIGLGTAAAVYFLTRERPIATKPVISKPADPQAQMQAGKGQEVRYDDNRLLGTVTHEAMRAYQDGRVVWEKFHYKLPNGTVLTADRVEARGKSVGGDTADEMTLIGRVRLRTDDGTTLSGDRGTYSETTGMTIVPGKTSFARAQMSGTGTGGTYERSSGVFKLLADAKVVITPEDASGSALVGTAASFTYTPDGKTMLFDQNARLERESETLTADVATLFMTDDEKNFRLIELRTNARVQPEKGKDSDLPEMRGNDIDLGFHDDGQALQRASIVGDANMTQGSQLIRAGQIDMTMAPDGKTLTRLQTARRPENTRVVVQTPAGPNSPARTTTGSTLVATGNDRDGLTAAVFEGPVEFVETTPGRGKQPGSKRVGTSRRLTMVLKGQLDTIEQAQFEQDVKFTSGNVGGYGEIGLYRESAGELELRPSPKITGAKAGVTDADAGVTVEATELVTVNLDTNNLYARRNVNSVTKESTTTKPAASTSMFNRTDPTYGLSTEFSYDDATKRATYTGTPSARARLTNADTVILGEQLVFFRERQDLQAKGGVESTFYMTTNPAEGAPSEAPKPMKYFVTSDALDYTEKSRMAKYTGNAVLKSTDGDTTAAAISLVLAPNERKLDRLEANGTVRSILEGGREALSEKLVYSSKTDLYELWGRSLTLITKETDGTCYGQDGNYVKFEGKLGAPDFPADQNADAGAPRRAIPCPAPPAKK